MIKELDHSMYITFSAFQVIKYSTTAVWQYTIYKYISMIPLQQYGSTAVHHFQVHLNDHGLANIHITAIWHYVFLWKYIKWTWHNGVMVQKWLVSTKWNLLYIHKKYSIQTYNT